LIFGQTNRETKKREFFTCNLICRAYRRLSQSLDQRVTGLCAVGLSILRRLVVLANPLLLPRDLNLTPRPGGHAVTLAQFEGRLSWFISAKADACGGGCIFCVLAIRGPSADPDDDVREDEANGRRCT